ALERKTRCQSGIVRIAAADQVYARRHAQWKVGRHGVQRGGCATSQVVRLDPYASQHVVPLQLAFVHTHGAFISSVSRSRRCSATEQSKGKTASAPRRSTTNDAATVARQAASTSPPPGAWP